MTNCFSSAAAGTRATLCGALVLWAACGLPVGTAMAQTSENAAAAPRTEQELLADFLHYVLIDRSDLAAAMGQELLDRKMEPVAFATLVEAGDVTRFDGTARRALRVGALEPIASGLLKQFEDGKLARARDPKEIAKNIEALSGTLRGKLLAKGRLVAAGEYAVPQLLEALLDIQNPERSTQVRLVLVDLGRQAIIPLCTALPGLPPVSQESVVDVIGLIPYRTSLPALSALAESTTNAGVSAACERAMSRLGGAGADTGSLYMQLAEGYYAEKNELTSFPNEEHQLVWVFDPRSGLTHMPVRTAVFHEAMAMKSAELAMAAQLKTGGVSDETVALWVASNLSREIDTPSGYVNPVYPVEGASMADATPRRGAMYFGVAAGPEVAQRVLARAIDERDTPLALKALSAVETTVGRGAIAGQAGSRAPLVEALTYPNRRVQYEAALALAIAQPGATFVGADRVVPTLAGTLRGASTQYAAIVASDTETYQGLRATLESFGYVVFPQGRSLAELQSPIAEAPAVDLVVGVVSQSDAAVTMVEEAANSSKLAATPVMVLAGQDSYIDLGRRFTGNSLVMVRQIGLPPETLLRAAYELVQSASGGAISQDEASAYSQRALAALRDLAVSGNTVLSVSDASASLIAALPEAVGESKTRVAEVLSRIGEERAQRAVMDAALDASGQEQIAMLKLVAESAKRFGSKLEPRQLTRVVELAKSGSDTEATAAAALMGALNLPSSEVIPLMMNAK